MFLSCTAMTNWPIYTVCRVEHIWLDTPTAVLFGWVHFRVPKCVYGSHEFLIMLYVIILSNIRPMETSYGCYKTEPCQHFWCLPKVWVSFGWYISIYFIAIRAYPVSEFNPFFPWLLLLVISYNFLIYFFVFLIFMQYQVNIHVPVMLYFSVPVINRKSMDVSVPLIIISAKCTC
jgi:hypothetical protein